MRNIYIVTRIIEGEPYGIAIPNLGVHSKLKSALSHYNSIIKDRTSIGGNVLYDRFINDNIGSRVEIKEAYIKYTDEHRETLRLEKWKV